MMVGSLTYWVEQEGSALVASLKEQHEETVATLQARIEVSVDCRLYFY